MRLLLVFCFFRFFFFSDTELYSKGHLNAISSLVWWRSPPPSSSSPIPRSPSVIMMGHWGPSISPWERGWGRGWCRGMRAKARALCQVTKAFQHNNSYQSLPEPVGLYGSLYGSGGMCRCLFMWWGRLWKGWGGGCIIGEGGHGCSLLCSSSYSTFSQSSRSLSFCLHNRRLRKQQGKQVLQTQTSAIIWLCRCGLGKRISLNHSTWVEVFYYLFKSIIII